MRKHGFIIHKPINVFHVLPRLKMNEKNIESFSPDTMTVIRVKYECINHLHMTLADILKGQKSPLISIFEDNA